MMNRAINHLVLATVDSLKKFKNKLAYYLAIFAMVFGSTFGTFNAANAVDLTENDVWHDGTGVVGALAAGAGTAVNIGAFTMGITIADAETDALVVGAITGLATTAVPTIDVNFADDADTTQIVTIASIAITGSATDAGLLDIDFSGANVESGTLNITGDADLGTEAAGVLIGAINIDVADTDTANMTAVVNIGGNVVGHTTFDQGATAQTITININGSADQSYTGTIDSDGGAGEGTLNITKATGTATFANNIGATEALLLIDATTAASTAVFNGTVSAVTIDSAGTMTFDGVVTATALNIQTAAEATFTGRIVETASSTSKLDLIGATTVTVGFGHTTAGSSNTMDSVDMHATSTLILADTITNGMHVFGTASVDAADVAAGSKIYMPVNLSDGQTIIIFKTDNGADVDEKVDSALQNNALITYDASGQATTIVTATEVAEATVATNLSVTTNDARALSQAYAAAINDTVADATAEDAFGNALNALGGMTATTDTDLALQVAPQTDTISGSAVATRAMTGTVQGIVSNRMASLRSGDAFVTGMSAGNGMSANSGFIQAFGSEGEQKNTGPATAKVYGYDSQTSGVAIGFDGMTETGETIGLSASYSSTDVDGKGTGKSKNAIDSYTVSVYADKATENGYIEGSLTYGINDNTSSRLVNTAGLSRTYVGNYDSEQISLKVGGGIPNEVKDGTFVTPFASATGTIISTDSYTETSTTANDALRLKIAQDDINSLVGTIGVKAHMITDKGTPMISFAINNEFGDTTINSTNTYTGGGTAFNTSTDVEELSATLGLGYSFGNDVSSVNIGYEANANEDDYLSHYGTVKIISKF